MNASTACVTKRVASTGLGKAYGPAARGLVRARSARPRPRRRSDRPRRPRGGGRPTGRPCARAGRTARVRGLLRECGFAHRRCLQRRPARSSRHPSPRTSQRPPGALDDRRPPDPATRPSSRRARDIARSLSALIATRTRPARLSPRSGPRSARHGPRPRRDRDAHDDDAGCTEARDRPAPGSRSRRCGLGLRRRSCGCRARVLAGAASTWLPDAGRAPGADSPPSAPRPSRKTTAASPVRTSAPTSAATRVGGWSVRLTGSVSARGFGWLDVREKEKRRGLPRLFVLRAEVRLRAGRVGLVVVLEPAPGPTTLHALPLTVSARQ